MLFIVGTAWHLWCFCTIKNSLIFVHRIRRWRGPTSPPSRGWTRVWQIQQEQTRDFVSRYSFNFQGNSALTFNCDQFFTSLSLVSECFSISPPFTRFLQVWCKYARALKRIPQAHSEAWHWIKWKYQGKCLLNEWLSN